MKNCNKWKAVLQDATDGYEKIIGDKLREDPTLLVLDVYGALENVVHQKGVYPGVCRKWFSVTIVI